MDATGAAVEQARGDAARQIQQDFEGNIEQNTACAMLFALTSANCK